MPVGDILPEISLLLTGVAILLAASFAPRNLQWLGAPAALAGIGAAAVLCIQQHGSVALTFSGVWALDGASVWGRLLILGAGFLAVLLSPRWFHTDPRHGEYYSMLLFSLLGAMVLAAASNLLQLVMGVLLSSVTGYTLAAWHRDWPPSVEAGMKYFLLGALANTALAAGVALILGMTGSAGYLEMTQSIRELDGSTLLMLGTALVVIGLAFKIGAVPAHAWMPDVAEGAPAPVSAFLTVVPKVGAAIALMRFVALFPEESTAVRPLVAAIAVATMTLGNLAALRQDDMRRMLGWSSVSQSGYALMAICVTGLSVSALPALLFFLLAYAAATMAAFSAVVHLRGRTRRTDYAGLVATQPFAAATLILAFLSLIGIPPLAGFVGKLQLFVATIDGGYAWLAAVAAINTVLSLVYYLRMAAAMSFGTATRSAATLGPWSLSAALLGVVATVVPGVAAGFLLGLFETATLLPPG